MPLVSAMLPSLPTGISGSVGRQGSNRDTDVRIVQILLNKAGAGIKEDGRCGRATISAIEEYQRNWTKHPDGRIDPGGRTLRSLVEGRYKINRGGYILLPQAAPKGYYSYSSMDRQYGTPATVTALVRICEAFTKKYSDLRIGIGDMSLANGAEMKPHKSHRTGLNADLRPLRKDGRKLPVAVADAEYSRERTSFLVEVIRADVNCRSILFNDSAIAGVAHWEDHDNHLHVSMKE